MGQYCRILANTPPDYVVNRVYLDGTSFAVTRFINYDRSTGLAYFWNGNSVVSVYCRDITAIDWF
ncbi:hypothetical protein [Bacillus kwashiorkori]|uniref:hypothetical protein n=1 Tax=Bacillus kwashiorkori TaxID=1522318 RepID=UPI00078413E0|nr:hypothetical protein [Bacillus kwashiorkori]